MRKTNVPFVKAIVALVILYVLLGLASGSFALNDLATH